ncbi:hypothetical protein ACXR0O_25645 [Verrucomicrobiota bacterium sgz303538]
MKTDPENRHCFSSQTQVPAGLCRKLQSVIATLKQQLLTRYTNVLPGRDQLLRKVISEAEAQAWETQFPHLFLPDFTEARLAEVLAADASRARRIG